MSDQESEKKIEDVTLKVQALHRRLTVLEELEQKRQLEVVEAVESGNSSGYPLFGAQALTDGFRQYLKERKPPKTMGMLLAAANNDMRFSNKEKVDRWIQYVSETFPTGTAHAQTQKELLAYLHEMKDLL